MTRLRAGIGVVWGDVVCRRVEEVEVIDCAKRRPLSRRAEPSGICGYSVAHGADTIHTV